MNAAILEVRRVTVPAQEEPFRPDDLIRLFALDSVGKTRRTLSCHWHRDGNGRLTCAWTLDIGPVVLPNRI